MLLKPENKGYILYLQNDNAEESSFSFEEGGGYPPLSDGPKVDVPFVYHQKLINILKFSGTGTSGIYINEAKCQQIIPLNEIFKLL